MKKKILYIILMLMILSGSILACLSPEKSDALKFKEEYEALNGVKSESREVNYPFVEIDKNNPMKYMTDKEAEEFLRKGTGTIFFGFANCPWCRNLLPVLLEAAKDMRIETIYYVDITDIRDVKKLDEENNIITSKEGTESYIKILNRLGAYLTGYVLTDREGNKHDTGEKRLLAPTVVFLNEGHVVLVNIGTVKSHNEKGDGYIPLTYDERKELYNLFIKGFQKTESETCDDDIEAGC